MEPSTGHVTGAYSLGTPWLTVGCCGILEIQKGFGPGSPTYAVPMAGPPGGTDTAVDAATGEVVVGYQGNNVASYFQGVAPSIQPARALPPGRTPKAWLVVAGLDKGPGVYGAYTPDDLHVRLARYGGGSVAVGAVAGRVPASLGVATGKDGRIWVMWGDTGVRPGIYVTRSNKTVTRFEPVQRFFSNAFDLWHIFGDGRLGPLDLLVNESPNVPLGQQLVNGLYYRHVLPELSAKVSVRKMGGGKFKVTVKVTDAGDPVSGAMVTVKGRHKRTNKHDVARLIVSGSTRNRVTVTIKDPGYAVKKMRVKL